MTSRDRNSLINLQNSNRQRHRHTNFKTACKYNNGITHHRKQILYSKYLGWYWVNEYIFKHTFTSFHKCRWFTVVTWLHKYHFWRYTLPPRRRRKTGPPSKDTIWLAGDANAEVAEAQQRAHNLTSLLDAAATPCCTSFRAARDCARAPGLNSTCCTCRYISTVALRDLRTCTLWYG